MELRIFRLTEDAGYRLASASDKAFWPEVGGEARFIDVRNIMPGQPAERAGGFVSRVIAHYDPDFVEIFVDPEPPADEPVNAITEGRGGAVLTPHECALAALAEHITIDPNMRGGVPTIKGTRLPVSQMLDEIAHRGTLGDVAGDYGIDLSVLQGMLRCLGEALNDSFAEPDEDPG